MGEGRWIETAWGAQLLRGAPAGVREVLDEPFQIDRPAPRTDTGPPGRGGPEWISNDASLNPCRPESPGAVGSRVNPGWRGERRSPKSSGQSGVATCSCLWNRRHRVLRVEDRSKLSGEKDKN